MKNEVNVNINGSVSGIVNLGNNTININEKKGNNVVQSDNISEQKLDTNTNDDFRELKEQKMSSNIFLKIISEIIIGVIISVIAGYVLYKLNIN